VEENWRRTSTAKKKKMELALTRTGKKVTTASTSMHRGHCKACRGRGRQGTLGKGDLQEKEMWMAASSTAGGRCK